MRKPMGADLSRSVEKMAPGVAQSQMAPRPAGAWQRMIQGIRDGDPTCPEEFLASYSRGVMVLFKHHLGPLGLDRLIEETMSGALSEIRQGRIDSPASLVVFFRQILARQQTPAMAKTPGGNGCAPVPGPIDRARIRRKADLLTISLRQYSNRDREILTRLFVEGEPEDRLLEEYGVSKEEFTRLKRILYDSASRGEPQRKGASHAARLIRSAASGL
ncbi:MAG: hypothetical protein JJE04_26250 [Acidobacteriia bacterium]|nr:hypothetical protein [Terriglobia bacterium]